MIRNIVFDIGNVLADFCWKEFLLAKGFGDAMAERIGDASVRTPVWAELDRGVWTDEELLEGFVRNDPEIERELRTAFADRVGMVRPRPEMIPWMRRFREAGYSLYYLSNFSEGAERDNPDVFAFLPEMSGGILSYRERLVKPDPAIYRLLTDRYALNPGECVFLDDTAINVDAARSLGWQGVVFSSEEQAEEALRQLGVRS